MAFRFLKPLGYILTSVLLLILSFPPVDLWPLVWIALIPLFILLDQQKSSGKAFAAAYFTGVLFFSGMLFWFMHVTLPGTILMMLYLGLYFGLFGWFYAAWKKRSSLQKIFLLPAVWVGLEYIRSHFLTGFGWVSLGYSQYKNIWLSQIADLTGVYGISFLIVMGNLFLKEIWEVRPQNKKFNSKIIFSPHGKWAIGAVAVSLVYGLFQTSIAFLPGDPLRVGIVQANIPQSLKWSERAWPSIMQKHIVLTEMLIKEHKPDLVIWPETAFPGFRWQDPSRFEYLKDFAAENRTYLLLGSITNEKSKYYNSAILISPEGKVVQQYDKLHLVPFGEFIPFREQLPFLADMIPIDDFTAGAEHTIFSLEPEKKFSGRARKFAVLICFEDGVSEIPAEFVKKGAQFLVNITNDAWFSDTQAPFLHMQASVLRAIENRRPVVRSANTGVSCFIDSRGRINGSVDNGPRKTFVSGYAAGDIRMDLRTSFYTKFGDIFTYVCFGCILWGIFVRKK